MGVKLMRFITSCILLSVCVSASAFEWQDLWQRRDQQAVKLLEAGKAKQAAERFTDPTWQGVAQYRDKDYQQALQAFQQKQDARSYYNQGNTLAKLGKYQEAIDSYNNALKRQKHFPDAKYNRELLKKLLKQQQQQNQKNQQAKQNKKDKKKQDNKKQRKKQTKNNKQPQPKPQWQPQKNAQQQLNKVPDNPGGLLRRKFLRDYLRRQQGEDSHV